MTHYIRTDEEVECANCHRLTCPYMAGWRAKLPEPPQEMPEIKSGSSIIVDTDTIPTRRFELMLSEVKHGNTAGLVVMRDDGSMVVWNRNKATTPEQRAWLERRMAEAKAIMFDEPPP